MEEPKPSISPHELCEPIGADMVPIAVDVQRPASLDDWIAPDQIDSPVDPRQESSIIVYCDNEHEVREGFAIALRAMGLDANLLFTDIASLTADSNREDN